MTAGVGAGRCREAEQVGRCEVVPPERFDACAPRADPVPVVVATLMRPTGSSGVQTHVEELSRYLRAQRLPVEVVTPFSWGNALRSGLFGLRRLVDPISGAAGVRWYVHFHRLYLERALRYRLAGTGRAVVYCQCPVSALAALAARRACTQKVVLAVHFCASQADEWVVKGRIPRDGITFRAIRRAEAEALARVDGVVFVSEAARSALWTAPPSEVPTVTLTNFVAAPDRERPTERRADLLTVGALEPHKNHAFALEVLVAARRRGHRLTLDIVGEGPDRSALARRARSMGLESDVRFLGHVPAVRQTLAGYRAYVHCATREACPLAVIEAMAAGVPVVAAPVGGVRELFTNGVEGRFWPLDDADRAAEVLVGVLRDDAVRARMGAAGSARFRRSLDAAVVCPSLLAFFERDVLGSACRSPAGAQAGSDPAEARPTLARSAVHPG